MPDLGDFNKCNICKERITFLRLSADEEPDWTHMNILNNHDHPAVPTDLPDPHMIEDPDEALPESEEEEWGIREATPDDFRDPAPLAHPPEEGHLDALGVELPLNASTVPKWVIVLDNYTPKREDESNIMRHAKRELELWGGPGYSEEMDAEFNARVLDVLRIFTSMGHSGLSASIFTGVVKALMDWENLTPLTDNPNEWILHQDPDDPGSEPSQHPTGQWQSARRPDAFSEDGGKTYRLLDEDKWVDHRTWKTPFRWIWRAIAFRGETYDIHDRKRIRGPLHTSTQVDPALHGEYI